MNTPVCENPTHHFHGGLELRHYKQMSLSNVINTLPIPNEIVLPLIQHRGSAAEPIVAIGDYVLKGQEIAKPGPGLSAAIHASTSGTIKAITERTLAHPSGLCTECIIIEPDGKDQWIELEDQEDWKEKDPKQLADALINSGITGLGGAVFPTHVKLHPNKKIHTIILNGAECEPYISCDEALMMERAHAILQGGQVLMHILGAERCLIAIEDPMQAVCQTMNVTMVTVNDPALHMVRVPTIYPEGGEKQLIEVLLGEQVPRNGIPADLGIVVQNVATAAAIRDFTLHGIPLIERVVTVTGEGIENPGNYRVPLGIHAKDLIEAAGGECCENPEILVGGPMMGFQIPDRDTALTKACNCLLVQPKAQTPAQGIMPCIRCGQCAQACPAQLLPQELYWNLQGKEFNRATGLGLFDCIECGCCAYVCPSHIPLVDYYRFGKSHIRDDEAKRHKSEIARHRHEYQEQRKIREKAERAAKAAARKAALKARSKDEIAAAVARSKANKQQDTPSL
ncbi:MAG: electron transport complex subunit RsxC [bacterium]